MHSSEIDGVPVFWQQGPAPLSAGLCFGVGQRDESFATGGITHLVEHLVMGSLAKSHLDRNACVDPKKTEFTATGRPEAVAGFLAQVCHLLADLPTDRLATEARVLVAEQERAGSDLVGLLLMSRYGGTGLGLLGMAQPGLSALTAEQVREHAGRWFVRENAALWLTGPPPEGLRLLLPSGAAPPPREQRRLELPLPAQLRYPGSDPAMSFESAAEDELLCASRILLERLTDRLRHQGGHSYDVDFDILAADARTAHVAFSADAPAGEVTTVLEVMHAELRQLAETGPTAEELAHDVAGFREHTADPRAAEGAVVAAVGRHFDGLPPTTDQDRLARLAAVRPEQVAAALEPALTSLLLLVPEDAQEVLPQVPALPDGTPGSLTGRTWKRRLRSDAPWGARLISSGEGVTLRITAELSLTVRYDDCIAVGVAQADHQHLELVGGHGMTVVVCEQDWKGGRELVEEVQRASSDLPRFTVTELD